MLPGPVPEAQVAKACRALKAWLGSAAAAGEKQPLFEDDGEMLYLQVIPRSPPPPPARDGWAPPGRGRRLLTSSASFPPTPLRRTARRWR